jgi:hypothetical protein
MVVGRPPDEACGSGTGAGTLRAGALPDASGPFLPATKKGCATAASATCQGTIQCKQPAKAKRETTKASWPTQAEGIARMADLSWPLVATCHTRQSHASMVMMCGPQRACGYGRGCTCAERCNVSGRAFSFLTAATPCASSRLDAPPRVWRWRRSSLSPFAARLVSGTLCSRAA